MIYIVRHGQTAGNKANILRGRGSNEPLNEIGIQQADNIRRYFVRQRIPIDLVFSSPLIRAMHTAKIIAGNAEIRKDEHLLEMDYGPYEGMSLEDPAPEVRRFFSDFVHNPAPEGMEPLTDVVDRLGEFLDEIRYEAENKNILLSTHAIAMKGALEYLTPESKGAFWSKYIRNCALYKAEYKDGRYGIPEEIIVS